MLGKCQCFGVFLVWFFACLLASWSGSLVAQCILLFIFRIEPIRIAPDYGSVIWQCYSWTPGSGYHLWNEGMTEYWADGCFNAKFDIYQCGHERRLQSNLTSSLSKLWVSADMWDSTVNLTEWRIVFSPYMCQSTGFSQQILRLWILSSTCCIKLPGLRMQEI